MNISLIRGSAVVLAAMLALSSPTLAQKTPPQQLAVTVALIQSGGGAGAGSFSSVRTLAKLAGTDALQAELSRLRTANGSDNVDGFIQSLDYTFIDGWQRAGQNNVKMPPASSDTGTALAMDMIRAGTDSNHTFHMSTMMNALWTPRVYAQVQADLASRYGSDAAQNFESIGDQFFIDLASQLGAQSIR